MLITNRVRNNGAAFIECWFSVFLSSVTATIRVYAHYPFGPCMTTKVPDLPYLVFFFFLPYLDLHIDDFAVIYIYTGTVPDAGDFQLAGGLRPVWQTGKYVKYYQIE